MTSERKSGLKGWHLLALMVLLSGGNAVICVGLLLSAWSSNRAEARLEKAKAELERRLDDAEKHQRALEARLTAGAEREQVQVRKFEQRIAQLERQRAEKRSDKSGAVIQLIAVNINKPPAEPKKSE